MPWRPVGRAEAPAGLCPGKGAPLRPGECPWAGWRGGAGPGLPRCWTEHPGRPCTPHRGQPVPGMCVMGALGGGSALSLGVVPRGPGGRPVRTEGLCFLGREGAGPSLTKSHLSVDVPPALSELACPRPGRLVSRGHAPPPWAQPRPASWSRLPSPQALDPDLPLGGSGPGPRAPQSMFSLAHPPRPGAPAGPGLCQRWGHTHGASALASGTSARPGSSEHTPL